VVLTHSIGAVYLPLLHSDCECSRLCTGGTDYPQVVQAINRMSLLQAGGEGCVPKSHIWCRLPPLFMLGQMKKCGGIAHISSLKSVDG
jgi:hypothetical protein